MKTQRIIGIALVTLSIVGFCAMLANV